MELLRFNISMINDWLDFFDNRGFHDHSDWDGCYCTYYHYPKEDLCPSGIRTKRDYAIWLLENKIMNGYVVYDMKKIIGWCNVGQIQNYPTLKNEDNSKLAIMCFLIEKQYRNQGLSRLILKEIIKDAKRNNFKEVIAFPNIKPKTEYSNYHGSVQMYLEENFVLKQEKRKNMMVLELR